MPRESNTSEVTGSNPRVLAFFLFLYQQRVPKQVFNKNECIAVQLVSQKMHGIGKKVWSSPFLIDLTQWLIGYLYFKIFFTVTFIATNEHNFFQLLQLFQRPHAAKSGLWWCLGPAFGSHTPSPADSPQHLLRPAFVPGPLRLRGRKSGRAVLQRERYHLLEDADWRELVRREHSRPHRIFSGLLRHSLGSTSKILMNTLVALMSHLDCISGFTSCHRRAGSSSPSALTWSSTHPSTIARNVTLETWKRQFCWAQSKIFF